jgi:Na+/melibiose symporter-like transporter
MNASYRFALGVFAEFGATMAVPAVAAAWLGQRLDRVRGGYTYTALFLGIAFILTALWVVRRTRQLAAIYTKLP